MQRFSRHLILALGLALALPPEASSAPSSGGGGSWLPATIGVILSVGALVGATDMAHKLVVRPLPEPEPENGHEARIDTFAYTSVRYWSSVPVDQPKAAGEKAIILLGGNSWGFHSAQLAARMLASALNDRADVPPVRVYTMAYLGQGSDAWSLAIFSNMGHSPRLHTNTVCDLLNQVARDGFATSDTVVVGHSIGGFFAGKALANESYDGIHALAVASPSGIGGTIGRFLWGRDGGWRHTFGNGIAWLFDWDRGANGFLREQAGIRQAALMTQDEIIPKTSSIAWALKESGHPERALSAEGGHTHFTFAVPLKPVDSPDGPAVKILDWIIAALNA